MKQYKKQWEDLVKIPPTALLDRAGSTFGSAEELAIRFQEFFRVAHRQFFDIIVRQVWLESQFTFQGVQRKKRFANSHPMDVTFGHFMLRVVGISQKIFSTNRIFGVVVSYLLDFFPYFYERSPFDFPEDFKYPYENITLDHLAFVQHVHNRLELLEYADKEAMNIADFENWATNHVLSYNLEIGEEMYTVSIRERMWPYIKRLIK